ncbi:MAG: hypothetical protein ACM3O5_02705 [Betaproteobacteria bacterium]
MTEPAAAVEARLSPTPLRGWPQRLLHLAALAAGWGLFVWGWYDVLGQPWETEFLRWLIAGSIVVLPLLTIAWVLHNVGIYRRKGPRKGTRAVDEAYRHDWNGREVSADFAALARANVVVIDIEGNRKVYRAGGAVPATPWVVTQAPRHHGAADRAADNDTTAASGSKVT